ncbi:MAG: glycosyltransferase family 4 protein [Promethearchaeota archaeon]
MKILHLVDTFDARFERDPIKLVELLEKRGYDVSVVTSRYSSDERLADKSEFKGWEKRFLRSEILHMHTIRIHTPLSPNPAISYLPSVKILRNYDIVHAYNFNTYSSLLASIVKKAKSTKMVLRSELSSSAYNKTKNAPFYRIMLTYPFKIANAVYAYSNLEKRYVAGLGVQESIIWVIPVGIDFDAFSKNPMGQQENITIGYIGRFCSVKGIHRVIPALYRLLHEKKKARVVFTGILVDVEYANNAMALLEKFRGFEFRSDLSMSPLAFYNMCDIILVPSISETGAKIVLEAMASGKAVIASNINPIKEYIQHERTGFLFNEEREVYLYLKKLIENPNLIKEIGKRARREATKYDWNLIIRRYEEMYRSVLR